MNDAIALVESKHRKKKVPEVAVGDTVRVKVRVTEGEKEKSQTRLQTFEGVVISRHGSGINETIQVRRISYGIGVERTFPLHSPIVDDIEVVREGRTRRAKLYFLRERVGKRARLGERTRVARGTRGTDEAVAEAEPEPQPEAEPANEAVEAPEAPDEPETTEPTEDEETS